MKGQLKWEQGVVPAQPASSSSFAQGREHQVRGDQRAPVFRSSSLEAARRTGLEERRYRAASQSGSAETAPFFFCVFLALLPPRGFAELGILLPRRPGFGTARELVGFGVVADRAP